MPPGGLARFYRPWGWGFELLFCPGVGNSPIKNVAPRGGGWSGLELTDTLEFEHIIYYFRARDLEIPKINLFHEIFKFRKNMSKNRFHEISYICSELYQGMYSCGSCCMHLVVILAFLSICAHSIFTLTLLTLEWQI